MTQPSMCLPTLSASALTKRYLTEREQEGDAEHNSPGATPQWYLTCACTHAGVLDFYHISPSLASGYTFSNSQSPCYSETWVTWKVDLNLCG